MPTRLLFAVLLAATGSLVHAQNFIPTLESALSMSPPRLPALLGDDPSVLKASGVKGPVIRVQPPTAEDIQVAELQKQQAKAKQAARDKVVREATRPKPVEATGRYLPTTDLGPDGEGDASAQEEVKLPVKNGQYSVD